MSHRARALALLAAASLAFACGPLAAPSSRSFRPTRYDYAAFLAGQPDLEIGEPNYLPFMARRFELAGKDEDVIVFCRWDVTRFPLAVYVDPPQLGPELWNEFDASKQPTAFAEAAWRALESWQRSLGGVVSFRRVRSDQPIDLRIRLEGAVGPAPAEGVQVLGTTRMRDACQVEGRDVFDSDKLEVHFEVPEIVVYVADEHGLLPSDQVERNVLHELGHALGMVGHSPIPADLMFEVARDRRVGRLSQEDVNSFRALYRLPNGTIYARLPRGADLEREPAHAPPGPPQLGPGVFVDETNGFTLRPALGWQVVAAPRGVILVDGRSWDYEASLQVIVRSYPTVASYLERHGRAHVRAGRIVQEGPISVAGRVAHWMRVEPLASPMLEDHVFVESGDGRVLIVIMEAPKTLRLEFGPWFDAMLASLQLQPVLPPGAPSGP